LFYDGKIFKFKANASALIKISSYVDLLTHILLLLLDCLLAGLLAVVAVCESLKGFRIFATVAAEGEICHKTCFFFFFIIIFILCCIDCDSRRKSSLPLPKQQSSSCNGNFPFLSRQFPN